MALLDILRAQWQEAVNQLQQLETTATAENRDLNEAELANAGILRTSIDGLSVRLESASSNAAAIARTQDLLRQLPVQTSPTAPSAPTIRRGNSPYIPVDENAELIRSVYSTPGQYLHDVIASRNQDREAQERLQRIVNEVTTDVPGIVPTPIIGELINIIDASRPTVASLRSFPMPQYGSSFTRPKVTGHTQVGVQGTQKTELASRKFTVGGLPVNKVTYGGALDIAFQVIDWTDPSALDAITIDLADEYAIQTEIAACSTVSTAAGGNTPVVIATTTAADVVAGLYQAAAAVYAGAKRLPDTLYMGVDAWAWLGGIVDSTGRPLFSMFGGDSGGGGGVSSFTGNPLGLRPVVSPGFVANEAFMASSKYAEVYEDRRGALRVVEPKLLGWEIAYYGYFAALVTEPLGFIPLTFTGARAFTDAVDAQSRPAVALKTDGSIEDVTTDDYPTR